MYFQRSALTAFGLLLLTLLAACNDKINTTSTSENGFTNTSGPAESFTLTVYKSPTCGCCKKWMTHLEDEGITTQTRHPSDLDAIKTQHGIEPPLRSCHTAVSSAGYVFEGHIPARYIQQFLTNPPADAIGLAVPAMPVGSPGMEVADTFMPYQVLLIKNDGSTEVFAYVEQQAQQYQGKYHD